MKKKILMSIFTIFLSLTMVGGIFLAGDNVIPVSTPAEVEQEEKDEESSAEYYGPNTSETWMDYAKKTWTTTYRLSGSGTVADPFLIKDQDDFINNFYRKVSDPDTEWTTQINGITTNARNCHYKLMCDIDLSERYWTPIGSYDKPFLGSFDGNGHAITGMYIGSSNVAKKEWSIDRYDQILWWEEYSHTDYYRYVYAGLFGSVGDSSHQNVTIKNFSLSGDIWFTIDISKKMVDNYYYVGGVLGHASYGYVQNVNSNVSIEISATGTNNTYAYVGGVVGQCWEVKESTNHGEIYLNETSAVKHTGSQGLFSSVTDMFQVKVGGIIGNAWCVYNCVNYGDIDCEKMPATVGGIAGQQTNGWNFDSCVNLGDIYYEPYEPSDLDYMERYIGDVGGIVGYMSNGSELQNCANYGSITGYGSASTSYYYSGWPSNTPNIGWAGIVGRMSDSRTFVNKSINYGDVSAGPVSVGGLAGHLGYGSVYNSVNLGEISGASYNYWFSTNYTHGQICGGYQDYISDSAGTRLAGNFSKCYSAYTGGEYNGIQKTKSELNSLEFYNNAENWVAAWDGGDQFNGSFVGRVAENYGNQWSLSPLVYLAMQDLYNYTYMNVDYGYTMVPTAVIKVLNVEVGYENKEGNFVEFKDDEYGTVISPYQIEYVGNQKYINQEQTRKYYYLGGTSVYGDGGHHNTSTYYPQLSVKSVGNYAMYFEYDDDAVQIGKGTGTSFVENTDLYCFAESHDSYITIGFDYDVMVRGCDTIRVMVNLKKITVSDLTVKIVNEGRVTNPNLTEAIEADDLKNKGFRYHGNGGVVELYGYFTYIDRTNIKVKATPNLGYYFDGLSSPTDESISGCDVFENYDEDAHQVYGDSINAKPFDNPGEMENLNVYIRFVKISYLGNLYYMEKDTPEQLRAENPVPILNLLFPSIARFINIGVDDDAVSIYLRNTSDDYSDGLDLGYYYDVYLFPYVAGKNITRDGAGEVGYYNDSGNWVKLKPTKTGLEIDRYQDDLGAYHYDLSFSLQNEDIFSNSVINLFDFDALFDFDEGDNSYQYKIRSKQETSFKIYVVRSTPIDYTINLHDLSDIYTTAKDVDDPNSYYEFSDGYGGSTSFDSENDVNSCVLNVESISEGDEKAKFVINYDNAGKYLNEVFAHFTYFSVGHDGTDFDVNKCETLQADQAETTIQFTLGEIADKYFDEIKDSGYVIDLYTYFRLKTYGDMITNSLLFDIELSNNSGNELTADEINNLVQYKKSANDGTIATGLANGGITPVYYLEPIEFTAIDYEDSDTYAGYKFVGYYYAADGKLLSTNKKYIMYAGEDAFYGIVAKYTTFNIEASVPDLIDYNGTKTYNVSTPEHLIWLSNQVEAGNTFENITIRQQCDIDMATKILLPIGSNTTPFKGTYDGNGYLIKNLSFVGGELSLFSEMGLFGVTEGATIKNLTLIGGKVYGYSNVGAFVGKATNTKFEKVNNYSCEVETRDITYYDSYRNSDQLTATTQYRDSYTDSYYDSAEKKYVDIEFVLADFRNQTNYAAIVGESTSNTFYMASNRINLAIGDPTEPTGNNVGGIVGIDDGNSTFELSFSENEKFGNGVDANKIANSYYIYEYKYTETGDISTTQAEVICYYMQDSEGGYYVYNEINKIHPDKSTSNEKTYTHYAADGGVESLDVYAVEYDPAIWMQLYGKYVLKCYYWH